MKKLIVVAILTLIILFLYIRMIIFMLVHYEHICSALLTFIDLSNVRETLVIILFNVAFHCFSSRQCKYYHYILEASFGPRPQQNKPILSISTGDIRDNQ